MDLKICGTILSQIEKFCILLSVSTGSIIRRTYIIAYALYICVKRIYRETLAKQ